MPLDSVGDRLAAKSTGLVYLIIISWRRDRNPCSPFVHRLLSVRVERVAVRVGSDDFHQIKDRIALVKV